ncbi:hypothetical protein [Sediminibacterium ginsengisoli]|uniref:Uncharacterized protein n=1 Tax=Sediminibacterium ginsengisoli TaxID=413434 RepID=A0A1T4P781_9BACT|nr:hypothetical protein [Sediminibacterium ginsengisoli]SJZ87319.1 hypothetical protein SAMN04488132_105190 [Sediminibacterium ginsengisoli]
MGNKSITDYSSKDPDPNLMRVGVLLKAGNWKTQLTDHEYELLIAGILNDRVQLHELVINGYLLKKDSLYLVIETHCSDGTRSLNHAFSRMEERVRQYMQTRWLARNIPAPEILPDTTEDQTPFFERHPLTDQHLIQLITGGKATLPYNDPHIAEIKESIRSARFCSALDYAGGQGPVLVKLIKHNKESL